MRLPFSAFEKSIVLAEIKNNFIGAFSASFSMVPI